MSPPEKLLAYEAMWTTEKDNYVLVTTEFGYGFFNALKRCPFIIHDDEDVVDAIIRNMLDAGVRVMTVAESRALAFGTTASPRRD